MEPLLLSLSFQDLFATAAGKTMLETRILPQWIPERRWFGGKARVPEQFRIEESAAVSASEDAARLVLVRVDYATGPGETYLLPLAVSREGDAGRDNGCAGSLIARFNDGGALVDALHIEAFRGDLLRLLAESATLKAGTAEITGERGSAFPEDASSELPSHVLQVEQSNSSVIYGDRIFLKLFRKLEDGENPDVEISRFLSERQRFPHVAPFYGAIEFRRPQFEPRVLALALGMVPNRGDAWVFTLSEVSAAFDRLAAGGEEGSSVAVPSLLDDGPDPEALILAAGSFAARARQLGVRTGQMHLALAGEAQEPAFSQESFSSDDQQTLAESVGRSIEQMLGMLEEEAASRGAESGEGVHQLLAARGKLRRLAAEIGTHPIQTTKTRTHGDYHLGQVLNTGDDFVIIDFEGEPRRSLAARKEKRSPLRDVAGMIRSFDYAAHCELMTGHGGTDRGVRESWAEPWAQFVSRAFLDGWIATTKGASFVPEERGDLARLLDAFLLEKAVYEVDYELNNRPSWVTIPIRGILRIIRG